MGEIKFVRITDIQKGRVNWDSVPYCKIEQEKINDYLLSQNDILIARTGGTIGKSFIINKKPATNAVFASYLIRLTPSKNIDAQYIKKFLETPLYWDLLSERSLGIGQPNVNSEALKSLFIPIPTIEEQKRIVSVVENLKNQVDGINEEYVTLSSKITQTKSKLLDLAIRGKLLPQNPNDEPASILLERTRREQESIKTKRKSIGSYIFKGGDNLYYEKIGTETRCIQDEIPFDIPNSWAWTRFDEIAEISRGGSPRPINNFITTALDGINWIKIGDAEKGGKYITYTKERIKREGMKYSKYVESGDFLLSNSMSFGRPYILKTDGCIHDGWLSIKLNKTILDENFLYFLLSSKFMYLQFSSLAVGSTVKNLKSDSVKIAKIPLPPIEEQKRIVECISKANNQLDSMLRE